MADDLINVTEQREEAPVAFQVAVNVIILMQGDQRLTSMPLHEVPLAMSKAQVTGDEARPISHLLATLSNRRARPLTPSDIEREERRLRDKYTFYEGEQLLDVFSQVYGEPANCTFTKAIATICERWKALMQREAKLTDDDLMELCQELLPSHRAQVEMPDIDMDFLELDQPAKETTGGGDQRPATKADTGQKRLEEKTKKGRGKAVKPLARPDPEQTPEGWEETSIDGELLEHCQGAIADEETAVQLARLASAAHGRELTDEALANVHGLTTPTKIQRARKVLDDFAVKQAEAAKAG